MNSDLFIDASILLSILDEDEFLPKITKAVEQYENIWISPLSYLFGYERCRRLKISLEKIHEELSFYEIVAIDSQTIEKAKSICFDSDFEDAVQVACALEANVPNFLTNDSKQAKRYKTLINTILLKWPKPQPTPQPF